MAIPSGTNLIAAPISGGTGPFTYSWSFSSTSSPDFTGVILTTPSYTTATNIDAVTVADPAENELLVCTTRCKVTDSTGLVAYAYFSIFKYAAPAP